MYMYIYIYIYIHTFIYIYIYASVWRACQTPCWRPSDETDREIGAVCARERKIEGFVHVRMQLLLIHLTGTFKSGELVKRLAGALQVRHTERQGQCVRERERWRT